MVTGHGADIEKGFCVGERVEVVSASQGWQVNISHQATLPRKVAPQALAKNMDAQEFTAENFSGRHGFLPKTNHPTIGAGPQRPRAGRPGTKRQRRQPFPVGMRPKKGVDLHGRQDVPVPDEDGPRPEEPCGTSDSPCRPRQGLLHGDPKARSFS
jgi:hypothetical protein